MGIVVSGGLLGLRDGLPGPPHSQLLPGLLVGGRGLLAWPWAEAFSLSSCSEKAGRGRGCQLAQGPGYRPSQGRWDRVSSATRLRPKAMVVLQSPPLPGGGRGLKKKDIIQSLESWAGSDKHPSWDCVPPSLPAEAER